MYCKQARYNNNKTCGAARGARKVWYGAAPLLQKERTLASLLRLPDLLRLLYLLHLLYLLLLAARLVPLVTCLLYAEIKRGPLHYR